MKILVLTTKENFKWTSMQEIIPSIERIWLNLNSDEVNVELICVDDLNIKEFVPKVLASDKFVITAFNLKMIRAFEVIKKSLNHPGQTFFYVHNMATIGCWPLNLWNFSKYLSTNDVFVVSCSRDIESMLLCYENARVILTPFTYVDFERTTVPKELSTSTQFDFVYVGRISAQKNLHSLLWGFSIFLKKKVSSIKLVIYGKEDDFGSPNMGNKCSGYLQHLKNIVVSLGIEQNVIFKGFVQREIIEEELSHQDYIMVSPSLHSDENFGMAAFKALINGKRCLLSGWGGHVDYRGSFDHQLELMKVEDSISGPVLSANSIARSMSRVAKKKNFTPHLPKKYTLKSIHETITNSLCENEDSDQLEIHEESVKILKNQKNFGVLNNQDFGEQIFTDYSDPTSKKFFTKYGMVKFEEQELFDRNLYQVAPWLKIQDQLITGKDFHKGEVEEQLGSGNYPLVDYFGGKAYISEDNVSSLLKLGYLNLSNFDINVDRYRNDNCSTSIDILKDRVSEYLNKKGIEDYFFADKHEDLVNIEGHKNIVLFGGYIQRILESGCWNFSSMHFWVLSPSVKNVLVDIFNFPVGVISVIGRSDLFETQKLNKVNLDGLVDFVYAGRISRVKNIELLIRTVHSLQKDFKRNIRLNLVGDFEDITPEYWGLVSKKNFEAEIKDLISNLEWKYEAPIIHRSVAWDQWTIKEFINPHYISLSSFICEDFSVSVAQAEELAWPCILSNWGAHRDVESALKVPMNLVLPFQKKNPLESAYAFEIAKSIEKNIVTPVPHTTSVPQEEVLALNSLDQIRRKFVRKWGLDSLFLLKDAAWKFAETSKGKSFYDKLLSTLGSYRKRENIIIVKEGLSQLDSRDLHLQEYFSKIEDIGNCKVMSITEVLQKNNLSDLVCAKKVYGAFLKSGCEQTIINIEKIIGSHNLILCEDISND